MHAQSAHRAARLVLFDADCGFCTRAAGRLARWTAATVAPLHAHDLEALGVDAGRADREMPAVLASDEVVYGADAVAAALASGRVWARAAGTAMRLPGVRTLARATYAAVARNRHRLPGGTGACRLP